MKSIILILLMLGLVTSSKGFAYTLKMTETQLQEKVSAMMPITRKKFMVTVVVSNPTLQLLQKSNLISIKSDIEAGIPGGLKGRGTVQISGSLSYDRKNGAFHLHNPKIVNMHVNGLPETMQNTVKNLTQNALSKTLEKRPVYKLKDDRLKHKLAKATLKSIRVEKAELVVELSLF